MSKRLTARNRLIAKEYSKKDRNGAQIARKHGITRGRVYQIVREYQTEKQRQERKLMEKKYNAKLPSFWAEKEKAEALEALADKMNVSKAHVLRWGVDMVLQASPEELMSMFLGHEPEPDPIKGI